MLLNPYAIIFRTAHEVLDEQGGREERIQLVFNREYQIHGIHPGRQNVPT